MANIDVGNFDLIVIGAGSGGIRAARTAASLDARVAIVEEKYLGGTCVNVGCVPKKLFVYASRFRQEFQDAIDYGWIESPEFDWPTLLTNKNKSIERLNFLYERMLKDAGITILRGRARLVDAHTVEVSPSPSPSPASTMLSTGIKGDGNNTLQRSATYTARFILIATGGQPRVPDFPGREHVITSDHAFFLERLPRRVVVVGGSYIAVEFACIFNGLGVETMLLHRGSALLRGFDRAAVAVLTDAMRARGVDLRFDTQVSGAYNDGASLKLGLSSGETLETDLVMCAIGRQPNTSGLGLERVGVRLTNHGAVAVDSEYRSSVGSIFAVGDVIERMRLTPVAIAEGRAVAHTLFGSTPMQLDYNLIPTAVFGTPELATVGLTEEAARAHHGDIHIYTSRFLPTRRLFTKHSERTFMKLVVEPRSNRVLGAHMVGDDAAEIIQGLAVAMKAGATKAHFDTTIGIHPSAAEEFLTMREPSRSSILNRS